jgi:type I restriction enzyme M protein
MAQRPVFVATDFGSFYDVKMVDFVYNGGFAVSQKQKNIVALHEGFKKGYPEARVLEISSKSLQPLGVQLSAFNLMKFVPSIGKSIPVENVFQGGKVFTAGGPFTDLYDKTPKEAKRDERLRSSGGITGFYFEGENFPTKPMHAFYDWIYISALMENEELAEAITEFDAFTDIEFNPQKSINCQALSAALFVGLKRSGKLEGIKCFEDFIEICKGI